MTRINVVKRVIYYITPLILLLSLWQVIVGEGVLCLLVLWLFYWCVSRKWKGADCHCRRPLKIRLLCPFAKLLLSYDFCISPHITLYHQTYSIQDAFRVKLYKNNDAGISEVYTRLIVVTNNKPKILIQNQRGAMHKKITVIG